MTLIDDLAADARALGAALAIGALMTSTAVGETNGGACAAPSAETVAAEIDENGLVAQIIAPAGEGPWPGLVVFGGSEGGTDLVRAVARRYAQKGFVTLALTYFKAPGLPDTLTEIPLEYVRAGVDRLAADDRVLDGGLAAVGISKGAELALLTATRDERIRAVAAMVPTHLVWQNIPGQDYTPRSSWTENGEPLAYAAYDFSGGFQSIFKLYDGALAGVAADSPARIPVERIQGPILLVSGAADTLWPSAKMADAIVERLEDRGFAHAVEHLRFEDAGHMAGGPPAKEPSDRLAIMGGTVEGNHAAQRAGFAAATALFNQTFCEN